MSIQSVASLALPQRQLEGRVALVTGAGSGLGRAFAQALAVAGARVVITELPGREKAAADAVAAITADGGEAHRVPLDVRDVAMIEATIEDVEASVGGIDILVNNAGINIPQPCLEVTEEAWDAVLDINLRGVFFTAQRAARRMVQRSAGKIINIASQNGLIAYYKRAAYCSAKAGVVNLTRLLAIELAEHNIQVNAVAPTFVHTALTAPMFEDQAFHDDVLARIPLGRIPLPQDITGAVVFLASPAADFITGHTLVVDGGWTAL